MYISLMKPKWVFIINISDFSLLLHKEYVKNIVSWSVRTKENLWPGVVIHSYSLYTIGKDRRMTSTKPAWAQTKTLSEKIKFQIIILNRYFLKLCFWSIVLEHPQNRYGYLRSGDQWKQTQVHLAYLGTIQVHENNILLKVKCKTKK